MNSITSILTIQDQPNESYAAISDESLKAASLQRAQELEQQHSEEQLPNGFYFSKDNLVYQPECINEDQDLPPPIVICSKLFITACTRDDLNHNHGRLLEFKDNDNHHHEWAMPMELLAGDGTRYREELLSMGLRIEPGKKARNLLTHYIQASKPKARARCVSSLGWHKNCFILPQEIIGNPPEERILLQTTSSSFPDYTSQGTLEEWQTHISSMCTGNNRLIFSASIGFAPPLLHLLGMENGGFHFRGMSSIGKTTALEIAASIWGHSKKYIQRWRSTTNGLETLATSHNDSLLCLDELSQADPDMAGESAYMLANGAGKNRSKEFGVGKRKTASWRLLFLSTGEISLASHMIEEGKKVRAGQEIRMVDIPADTRKYGMFENLHHCPNGHVFADTLSLSCKTFYGSASKAFLKRLIDQLDEALPLLRHSMETFIKEVLPESADGQIYRVAKRFALVAAAGELATHFGVTGWSKQDAINAAKTCFLDWLETLGGTGPKEEHAILSQVKLFFEQHGDSRFTPKDSSLEHKTINRAGFKNTSTEGEIEFFVFPETFKKEIAKGFEPSEVSRICLKHGLLRPGSKGEATRSERFPHSKKNTRCYRFTSKVLGDEDPSTN